MRAERRVFGVALVLTSIAWLLGIVIFRILT